MGGSPQSEWPEDRPDRCTQRRSRAGGQCVSTACVRGRLRTENDDHTQQHGPVARVKAQVPALRALGLVIMQTGAHLHIPQLSRQAQGDGEVGCPAGDVAEAGSELRPSGSRHTFQPLHYTLMGQE